MHGMDGMDSGEGMRLKVMPGEGAKECMDGGREG